MTQNGRLASVLAVVSCLCGCGSNEPTNQEIEKAWRSYSGSYNPDSPWYPDFSVQACADVANGAVFECKFRYLNRARTQVAKARFSRSRNSWMMSDLEPIASYNDPR